MKDLPIEMICLKDGKEKTVFIINAFTEPNPQVCDDGNNDAECIKCLSAALKKGAERIAEIIK